MTWTVAEALQHLRDEAGESEDSLPDDRMLRFFNRALRDYTEKTELLSGLFCPGELHSNGWYPLNDFHNIIVGNGGPDETTGPYELVKDSIWWVTWDYWAGTASGKTPIRQRSRREWSVYTSQEQTNTNANIPQHWIIEKLGSTWYMRLWPKSLTSTLGTASAAGATLEVSGARYHRELVASGASISQTTSLEVPKESIDTLIHYVMSKHYHSVNMTADEEKEWAFYLAGVVEDKIRFADMLWGGSFRTSEDPPEVEGGSPGISGW